MSAATMAVALRFWEAAEAYEETWDLLHPNIEVHDFDLADAGVYRGHDGFAQWLAAWEEPWDDYICHVHDFLELDGQVASLMHLRARTTNNLEVEREDCQLITVRDGKIAKLEYFGDTQSALARAADPARAAARMLLHQKIRSTYAPPFTVERLVDAGTSVVALLTFAAPDRHCAELWRTNGQDITSARTYASHEPALRKAGLRQDA